MISLVHYDLMIGNLVIIRPCHYNLYYVLLYLNLTVFFSLIYFTLIKHYFCVKIPCFHN